MALFLIATVWSASRDAEAKGVEGHAEAGVLVGVGFPELGARPTLGGGLTIWWAPHPRFHLGLEMGMNATTLPYGCTDAVPGIGMRGHAGCGEGLSENFTLLPQAAFSSRLLLTPRMALGASIGTTFIVARTVAEYAFAPYPTGGISFEARFGAGERFGLRTAMSYIHFAYGEARGLLAPTISFVWN